jgi:hypothetical protein
MRNAYKGPADRLALYDHLVASTPGIERKGATMPYTSRNDDHMFSFLDPAGAMCLRLSADTREEFMALYSTSLAEQHGHTMPEYVVVPPSLLDGTDELRPWLTRSHNWIGTLKPKPTKRR